MDPNFFIIGAPKCGTTTLAAWLSTHPDVFVSVPKEPHYFNTDMRNRRFTAWDRYAAIFDRAPDSSSAVGEASTWYLYSDSAVPAILNALPDARFIAMVRDPVEMAVSLFQHNRRHGHEDQQSFEVAWAMQGDRAEGRSVPRGCSDPNFLQYEKACALGTQLARLSEQLRPDQWHAIWLNDLASEPAAVWESVQDFLELPHRVDIEFRSENAAAEPKNVMLQHVLLKAKRVKRIFGITRGFGLMRLNETASAGVQLSDGMRQTLRHAFAAERALLVHMVGRPHSAPGDSWRADR